MIVYIQGKILIFLIYVQMHLIRQLLWKPLVKKTHDPQKVQNLVLKEILRRNKDAFFGKRFDFSKIDSYHDFRQRVPVQTYEDLRYFIEKQEETDKPYLSAKRPVMYALTSGTTGHSKYIPIQEEAISDFKKDQKIFTYALYSAIPSMYSGKILAITGPAVEGYSNGGKPFGSISGMLYKGMSRFIKSKFVMPPEIFEIENYDLKYFIICAFGLSHRNVTCLATANPSTLLQLSEIINSNYDELIRIVETGSFRCLEGLSKAEYQTLDRYFKGNLKRARELKHISKTQGVINFKDIWPNLKCVVTWTCGSCSVLIPKLQKQLSSSTHIVEMGYLSSEFRGNIVVDVLQNKAIPPIYENFYEFVEREDWENNNPNFLTLDQISEGQQYYILVTTRSGLYRYFINDIIEVTGKYNNTPTIKFIQKGKGTTNITGEKLYESQLHQAIQTIKKERQLDIDFFIMIADQETLQYVLYIEHAPVSQFNVTWEVEKQLSKLNIEYEAKRKSNRLKPLRLVFLKPGTGAAYKKCCVEAGQREGHFKIVNLQYNKDCIFDFEQYAYS